MKAEQLRRVLELAGVPRRYLNAKLEDFPKKTVSAAKEGKNGVLIFGPKRTELLVALMKWIIESKIASNADPAVVAKNYTFVNMNWFQFDHRNTGREFIRDLMQTHYLFIDDLIITRMSDFMIDAIRAIIHYRYAQMLPLFATSSQDTEVLRNFLDNTIVDKLESICPVHIKLKERK